MTGALLLVALCVAVLGLAATGRLNLYVHPRYLGLSVVMAVVGLSLATLGLVLPRSSGHPAGTTAHGSGHGSGVLGTAPVGRTRRRSRTTAHLVASARAVLVVLVSYVVLVLPPTTLSASLRDDRGLTSAAGLDSSPERLVGVDTTTFGVKDWAVLLQQAGADSAVGQPVDVTGYVLDRGQDDVFYVARLVISCCAVDAQPVGIAVRSPGWRAQLRPDSWVRVQGTFTDDTRTSQDAQPAVVDPRSVSPVAEPKNPYAY